MGSWLVASWPTLGVTAAKALLMYAVALLALRLAHRRTLAQWTAIDFAAAVAVGAIIGRTAIAENQPFAVGAAALVTILVAHWVATVGRLRSAFAKLVDHRVRVLVDHGQLRHHQLRRCGLTDSEVLARLRQQGVGSLDQVRYVLYETKGELTIVRESDEPDPELVRRGLHDATGFSTPNRRP
jgi:uncharacterized membrane protein YcaP (DUF421 family)